MLAISHSSLSNIPVLRSKRPPMAYHGIIRCIHGTLRLLILKKRDLPMLTTGNRFENIINGLSLSLFLRGQLCYVSNRFQYRHIKIPQSWKKWSSKVRSFRFLKLKIFTENLARNYVSTTVNFPTSNIFFQHYRKFLTLWEGAPRWYHSRWVFGHFSMTTPLSSC